MLAATALALAILGHGHARAAPPMRLYGLGVWRLRVYSDSFTGATSCSLRSPRVVIHRDTAIFELGPSRDTDHAEFRVDGGAARSVQEVTLADAHNGVFPDRGAIENPSKGEIAVPVTDMANARRVWIRPRPGGKIQFFEVSRLGEVLRSAAGLGCQTAAL